MTVVTQVTLKTGCEPEWDAAMRDRLSAAPGRPGWIGGQLLPSTHVAASADGAE